LFNDFSAPSKSQLWKNLIVANDKCDSASSGSSAIALSV
jgi:hypothetical protein